MIQVKGTKIFKNLSTTVNCSVGKLGRSRRIQTTSDSKCFDCWDISLNERKSSKVIFGSVFEKQRPKYRHRKSCWTLPGKDSNPKPLTTRFNRCKVGWPQRRQSLTINFLSKPSFRRAARWEVAWQKFRRLRFLSALELVPLAVEVREVDVRLDPTVLVDR